MTARLPTPTPRHEQLARAQAARRQQQQDRARARQDQVVALTGQGLTPTQIALQLGWDPTVARSSPTPERIRADLRSIAACQTST